MPLLSGAVICPKGIVGQGAVYCHYLNNYNVEGLK
jgi:hypothetical protein